MMYARASRTAVSLVLFCLTFLFVGCGYHAPAGTIQITAASSSLSVGQTVQLSAVDVSSSHATSTVTGAVTWLSGNASVATVSSSGLLTGVGYGVVTISARYSNGDSGALTLTVSNATLTWLTLSPVGMNLAVGSTQQYSAFATYSNNTTANVSSTATWSVAPASVARISSSGLLTAQTAGTFTVTAASGGQTATALGSVGGATLSSITITPANASISSGSTQQFTATGVYTDKSTQDLTSAVTWASSNTALLTITSAGVATSLSGSNGTVQVSATDGSVTSSVPVTLTPASALTDLVVKPTSSSIAIGSAEQHTATAYYADGTQKDVTKLVQWSSSDASSNFNARPAAHAQAAAPPRASTATITNINSSGVTVADTPGTSMVTATLGTMSQDSVVLVTPATVTSLAITATKNLFPVGATQALKLTGTFSDGSTQDLSLTANWQTSNPNVATIDSTGLASGVAAGNIVFSASFGGLTTSTTGFQVLPSSLLAANISVDFAGQISGLSEQLHVIGTYSDGSTHDLTSLSTFTSADPTIFSINAAGLGYGIKTGVTQITANVGGFQAITSINTYKDPITSMTVFPAQPRFALGTHLQFSDSIYVLDPDTGTFVQDVTSNALWVSSDPTVLTIDQNGLAKSGRVGTTRVSATVLGVTAFSDTVTVTKAGLKRIVLSSPASSVAVGTAQQYTATGFFDDGSVQDVTYDATFTTSDGTVASIDNLGLAYGMKPGQVQVTATLAGKSVTSSMTVTNATLVSTALLPGNITIPDNFYFQYHMIGTFSDGSTQDLNYGTTFLSPTPFVNSFFPVGLGGSNSPGVGQFAAQYGYFTASTPVTISSPNLIGVTLTPAQTTLRLGDSQQLTITAQFDDGTSLPLTHQAYLTSSNAMVVPAKASGLVYGTGLGTATLTATMYGVSGTANLTVLSNTLTSIALSPASASLNSGETLQLAAMGTYDDGTTGDVSGSVTWTSSAPSLLSISASGLATAATTFNTVNVTVTAQSGSVKQSFIVTVHPVGSSGGSAATLTSIAVGPTGTHVPAGATAQLSATGTYSDGSTQDLTTSAVWTSSQPATAIVSNIGVVTGRLPGQTTVSATVQSATGGSAISSGTLVLVSSAAVKSLTITPNAVLFAAGTTQQYTATATFTDGTTQTVTTGAAWTSSNNSVATIGSATGLATGVASGTVEFTATYGSITAVSGQNTVGAPTLISISVTPAGGNLTQGGGEQLVVTGTYSDGSTRNLTLAATYSSSNPAVVTVSGSGVVHAVGVGTGQITVSVGGQSFTTPAITVTTATLTSIAVTPATINLAAGLTQQLTATGTYSDGTTKNITGTVTWLSAAPGTATVNSSGVVTGVVPGTTTVQATSGSVNTVSTVTVTAPTLLAVTVTPTSAQIAAGTTQQLTATGTYSNGTTRDLSSTVTWSAVQPLTASVTSTGLVTGLIPSQSTITATQGSLSSSATIIVSAATLRSLAISPSGASLAVGVQQQYTLTGTFTDGSTQDLTTAATWTSASPNVAIIATATGLATGVTPGSVQFNASYNGQSATSAVSTVTPAVLVSLTVNPSGASFAKGTMQQFTVTGTYSDGSTHDLTSQATYTSSDPTVVSVASNGLATGVGTGSAQLTISVGGKSVTTPAVTVTPANLVSIAINPMNPSLAAGSSQQFTATGTFSDGSTQDLTRQAVWMSSNPSVLTIDSTGNATSSTLGSATVSATLNGVTASTGTIQVTPVVVTALSITPNTAQLAKGTSQQFTATATYSDGTTQNVSTQVTWSSSNGSTVGVSATGLATGQSQGTAVLTAALGSQTATTGRVQVTPATLVSLAFSPANPEVATGSQTQLTVIGTYSDGTMQNLTSTATFSSSNSAAVSVSSTGVLTGVLPGSSVITIEAGGITSTVNATATLATLTSIALTPNPPANFAVGGQEQFTLTGTYSDGHTQDLSSSATWLTSNSSVFTINTSGLATGTGVGSGTVTATYGAQTVQSSSFQVVAAVPTLSSITVTPTSAQLPAGTTQQLTATGVYSDGSTQNLTGSVTWSSAQPGTASVSAMGLVTGVATGQTTVTAQANGLSGSSAIVVSAAVLRSLAISPSGATFATGVNQQFTLTGTYSDGSTQNLTSSANWASTNANVATMGAATGLATGVAPGSVQFTATYNGQTVTSSTNTVSPATLVSIAVSPASGSFAKGTSEQFTVTGTYSDGSTRDLTGSSTFTSSDPAVISVTSGGLASGTGTGTATVTITSGGQSFTTQPITVTPATLVSIAVTPSTPSLADGTSQQFTATGTFSDGSTQDLSTQVTWASTDASVVTVNNSGLATGTGVGSAQVSATFNGTSGSTGQVTVTPATITSLMITPSTASIAKGTSQQFTATASFTDGTTQNVSQQATWMTSDGSIAGVTSTGLATGNAIGSAQITAAFEGQSASTASFTVTPATLVSLSFSPANPTVAAGTSAQVTVTGTYSDGSTQDLTSSASYSTSNPAVTTVSSTGLITGVAAGSATVTVSAGGQTRSFPVTVSAATLVSLAITPNPPASLPKGTTEQFTATGTYSDGTTQNLSSMVAWSSSSNSTVTVSSTGVATGVNTGSVMLTASYQGQTASTSALAVTPAILATLTVTPATATLGTSQQLQYTATGTYTDATTQDLTTQVTWSSSNSLEALISTTGQVTGLAPGTVSIGATQGALTGSANLTIMLGASSATLSSIAITPTTASVPAGGTQQYAATGSYSDGSTQNITSGVTWSSNNASATIGGTGLATGVTSGAATITASSSGVTSNSATLTVTPAVVTLTSLAITPSPAAVGKSATVQFTAVGSYSDGSMQNVTNSVTWQSSVPAVATVNANGLATGVSAGSAQIWASLSGQSTEATLTVSPATLTSLAIMPQTASVSDGTKQQYSALGSFSDGSTQDLSRSVTWTSSNTSLATLDANGLASTLGVGSVMVSASSGGVTSNQASLTITSATATSIQITPSTVSLPAGSSQQLTATATFTDGSSQNVTNSVTYSSSDPSVVTVDANGNLHAVGPGTATVTATLNGASTTVPVTISNAALSSITVTPANPSLPAGLNQQLTATGTYTDGSTQDLTQVATWTSSDATTVSVTSTGNSTAVKQGTATLTATYSGVPGATTVHATAAVATSIAVSPTPVTLAAGATQQFTATAAMSDGTQQNVTTSAHWSVSNPASASISNTSGSQGVLSATAAGTTTAMATVGTASASAQVTVTSATLTGLTINPQAINALPAGTTLQLTVTGNYSDASSSNVTSQVTWTTGSASTAYVDANGLLHAVGAGVVTIDAHLSGQDGTAVISVSNATLVSIAVTPASPTMPLGTTQQLTATGTYTDGSTSNLTGQVQWTSSAPAKASVSSSGLVTALGTGSASVTATLNGVSGSTTATVTSATLQSISVTSAQSSFALGQSLQLKAVGTYSDGTTQDITNAVTWISTAPTVGAVSSTGVATGRQAGSFGAKASLSGVSATETINVTNATLVSIAVTPTNQILLNVAGQNIQFVATGTFSDGSTQNLAGSVHWSSSGVTVGTISQTGVFTATGLGICNITATSGTITGSAGVTVVSALGH